MAGASKRRRPPKLKFGESPDHQAWDNDKVDVFHEPALPVTREQIQAIAASLKAQVGSEHVFAVLAAIRRYDGRETAMAELPPGDHRARNIKTLNTLALAIDGLNTNVRAALARYGVFLDIPAETAEAAREAAMEMERERVASSRSGRRPKISRAATLRELTAIYKMATGRPGKISTTSETGKTRGGKPTGRFFLFMRAAVAPVRDLAELRDYALAEAVKRATARTK
jgi:hypothetical protein